MSLEVLGVIPARLASTRLPRKLLREIAGRPLICWTYEAARRAPALHDVLVATDAQEIVRVCAAHVSPPSSPRPTTPPAPTACGRSRRAAPPTCTSTCRATSRW